MPLPTPQDVHIDVALSTISIGYRNPQDAYAADKIFPLVPVDKQGDKYYEWDKDYWFRNYVQKRTPGDTFPEGSLKLSNAAYFCEQFHLAFPIPDETRNNQDAAVDLDATAAIWLADQFMINREAKFVADFVKTGVWGTDKVGTTDFTKWSDYAQSDPIEDIKTGLQTIQKDTGQRMGLQLAMGQEVFDILAEHPTLTDKYKYTQVGGPLNNKQISDALKVSNLVVSSAVENTANEGAAFVGGYTWGKNALLLYVPSSPGKMTPSAGYTFMWKIAGGLTNVLDKIRQVDRNRDLVRGQNAFDQKATATKLGYYFSAAV